jgi:hypothetical protein
MAISLKTGAGSAEVHRLSFHSILKGIKESAGTAEHSTKMQMYRSQ